MKSYFLWLKKCVVFLLNFGFEERYVLHAVLLFELHLVRWIDLSDEWRFVCLRHGFWRNLLRIVKAGVGIWSMKILGAQTEPVRKFLCKHLFVWNAEEDRRHFFTKTNSRKNVLKYWWLCQFSTLISNMWLVLTSTFEWLAESIELLSNV